MSFTHRANATATTDPVGTSITFTVADLTNLAVGDLMVAVIGKDDDVAISGVPSGWRVAIIQGTTAGADVRSGIYWKVAVQADVDATNFVWTGDSEKWSGTITAFASTNGGNLVAVSAATLREADSTPISAAISAATSGNLLVAACVGAQVDTGGLGVATAGYTVGGNPDTGQGAGDNGSILAYDLSAAGGETTVEFNNGEGGMESHPYLLEFEDEVPPSPIVQANSRIRDNDDELLNSTTFSHALNTDATLDLETRFRIRFEVDETTGVEAIDTYELWASLNSGSYAKVDVTPLDWGDRTATNLVEHVDSKQYANSDATTDVLSGADAFTAGDGVEEGGVTDSITLNDQHTEIEFCLLPHRIADGPVFLHDGDTIDFQIRKAGGASLDAYTNTPRITVNEPAGLIGGCYIENPNVVGPFEDGNGNKYVIVEPSETDPQMLMMKSTDGGDSWTEMDGAGRPTQTDLEGVDVIQDVANDRLLVFHQPGAAPKLHIFNTSDHTTPDDWSTIDEDIDTALLDAGDQQIVGALRSDGTMVAVYTGDTTDPRNDFDVWFNVRSSGGTWGTPVLLWNLSNNDNWGVTGVLGNDDDFYLFACDNTAGDLFGKMIRGSDDSIADLFDVNSSATANGTSVDTNVGSSNAERQNHTQPQYWNDGADKIFLAWKDDTDNDLEGVVITVGTSGSVGTVGASVNDADVLAQSNGASRQPVASVIRHSNGDFHAFFATEPTSGSINSNLKHDVSDDDGATWTTDDTVTVRSPKSRINWVRAFEQPDGNIGLFYDDGSGTEQNNSVTGGDDTSGTGGLGTGFIWYDEYAVGGGEQTVAVGVASEVETAQAVIPDKPIVVSVGTASETETAQVASAAKSAPVGVASEVETAQVVPPVKTIVSPVGVASEVETAQTVAVSQTIVAAVGLASEVETAEVASAVKSAPVGVASEVETAEVVPPVKSAPVGVASEVETTEVVAPVKTIVSPVGTASEVETAQVVPPVKSATVGTASEVETAETVPPVKTIVSPVGVASEVETAQAVPAVKTIVSPVGVASEVESAQIVAALQVVLVAVSVASEVETAETVVPVKTITASVGVASEVETAQAVPPVKSVLVGLASEVETAETVLPVKSVPVGVASEVETAETVVPVQPGAVSVGVASEVETAEAVPAVKTITSPVGLASEVETAEAVPAVKTITSPVGLASEVETAGAVAVSQTIVSPVGVASEVETAEAVAPVKTIVSPVGTASEVETAETVPPVKSAPVGLASEVETAETVPAVKPIFLLVGVATETGQAHAVAILVGGAAARWREGSITAGSIAGMLEVSGVSGSITVTAIEGGF